MDGFGKRLKSRAAELNLKDSEVARRAGLSSNRYSNYTSDYREPDLATLVRIVATLETSADELLGLTGSPKKSERATKLDRLLAAGKQVTASELDVIVRALEALAAEK